MLIDETNWKQERANLQSQRILLEVKLRGVQQEEDVLNLNWKLEAYYKHEIAKLDKAIETIENVFVHKRCYI